MPAPALQQGALMPINLLMASEFKSDSDGKFFAEDKSWKLYEVPEWKFYPQSAAAIFEQFRHQQRKDIGLGKEARHNETNFGFNPKSISCAVIAQRAYPVVAVAVVAALLFYFLM